MTSTNVPATRTPRRPGFATVASALVSVLLLSSPALAQQPVRGDVGVLGVYFDAALTQNVLVDPPEFVPFDIYIAMSEMDENNPTATLQAWEMNLQMPAGWSILSKTLNPSSSLDFGTAPNYRVGTGSDTQLSTLGGELTVMTLNVIALGPTPDGSSITPRGLTTGASVDPAEPVWIDGDRSEAIGGQQPFYRFREVISAEINPVPCLLDAVVFEGATSIAARDADGNTLWTANFGKPVLGADVVDLDGDTEPDVLYWTAAGAGANGEIGSLDCLGNEVWSFQQSDLNCDPTEGGPYLDVQSYQLGEFDAGNAGQELLLVAGTSGLSRLTLHALDGTLLNGGLAETWADYTAGVVDVIDGNVYFGGVNSDGFTAVLRDEVFDFRGSTGLDDGACAFNRIVERVFDTSDPVTGFTVADGELTIDTLDGNLVVDALTLQDVNPCNVFGLEGSETVVVARDEGGNEVWSYDAGTTILLRGIEGLPSSGEQFVTVFSDDAKLVQLDCEGNVLSDDFAFVNCFGGTADTAAGPVVTGSDPGPSTLWFLVTDSTTGATQLVDFGRDGNGFAIDASYDIPGTPTASAVEAVVGLGETVYLAFNNPENGDAAQIVALDPTNVAGSAPPVADGCDAGTEIWSTSFESTDAITDLVLDGAVLRFTVGGDELALDAATGAVLTSCNLADVTFDGSELQGLDIGGNVLFSYGANGPVFQATVLGAALAEPVVVGVADATDSTQAQVFRIRCDGTVEFETPLVSAESSCWGVPLPRAALSTALFGAFTAEGANELWAVLGGVAEGETNALSFIVTVDVAGWSFVGTYAHIGPIEEVLPLDGFPLQVAVAGFNENLGGAAAFLVEAGADGESYPGCLSDFSTDNEVWYRSFDGSLVTAPVDLNDPFTAIAVEGENLIFSQDDGTTVTIARDGTLPSTGIADVAVDGTDVIALDAGASELFRRDLGVPLERAGLAPLDQDGDPEIVVAGSGQVFALSAYAQGAPLWSFGPDFYETCFTEPVATRSVAEFAPALAVDGEDEIVVVFETTNPARLAILTVSEFSNLTGNLAHLGTRVQHEVLDFDDDGVLDVLLLGTDGSGNGVLFLASLADLEGATPYDQGACDTSSTTFALAFDGTDLRAETDPVSFAVDGDRVEVVFGSGNRYLVNRDGSVLSDVQVSLSPASGEAKPGEVYAVSVELDNAPNVAALQGVLTYDTAAFEVVDATAVLPGATGAINTSVEGEVRFALASDQNLGQNAATALEIQFAVLADAPVGSSAFEFVDVLAFDETPSELGVVVEGATVDVGCETGDVNGDGAVRSDDAVLALRLGVGLVETPTAFQLCAADVNGDGEVDSGDAVSILRQVVGLPIDPSALAKTGVLDVRLDGDARVLGGDRAELTLRVTAHGDVAGVDLTLDATEGLAIETVSIADATTALHLDGRTARVSAANANALDESGDAFVRVVVRGIEPGADAIALRIVEGRTYGTDGRRSELGDAATITAILAAPEIVLPRSNELVQNVPNPFNPRTEILFRLAEETRVRIHIYDVAGRRVHTLDAGSRAPGEHGVVWRGDDDQGRPVASGVYMYQLETREGVVDSKRMTLVR